MSLELMEVSGLVTIQDSGRAGWMRFGVPSSGPMDRFAFQASNALAGNPPDSAVIEVGLGDAVFRASRDCVVAVAGIGFDLSVYIWDFPLWSSFFVISSTSFPSGANATKSISATFMSSFTMSLPPLSPSTNAVITFFLLRSMIV